MLWGWEEQVEPYSLQTLTNFSKHHASQVPELDPQCRNARIKNKRKWLIKYQEAIQGSSKIGCWSLKMFLYIKFNYFYGRKESDWKQWWK